MSGSIQIYDASLASIARVYLIRHQGSDCSTDFMIRLGFAFRPKKNK